MFEFFSWIGDFFTMLWDLIVSVVTFVITMITGLIEFLQLLPTGLKLLVDCVGYVPMIIGAFVAVSVTVSVIFITLGRGSTNG